jgi:hypothetical protein
MKRNSTVNLQRIGLDNWKTITKPGYTILKHPKLCVIIYLLEFNQSYIELLEVLLFLVNRTTDNFMVLFANVRSEALLELFDGTCYFS